MSHVKGIQPKAGSGPLRFAVLGAGFWARYQLAGWKEAGGAVPAAVYNRTKSRAEALAQSFGIATVYDDACELLDKERATLDFVDIITDVGTHAEFVRLASERGLPVICQKPMGTGLAQARDMVAGCARTGVPFAVHENWRWQAPIREFARVLKSGVVGRAFRDSIDFSNSFPVFDNQPFLAELEQFVIADLGSHVLDVARFLFGEAASLYCRTSRVNPRIAGEDVATVVMDMGAPSTTVVVTFSYASRTERERFPQTFIHAECEGGSVELCSDWWIRVTDASGTHSHRCAPPRYAWADPDYDVVHSSIVACNSNLRQSLVTGEAAETSGADNLRTVELVYSAYASAASGDVVRFPLSEATCS